MNNVHFSSKSNDWETPQALFEELTSEFGGFDVDVCASEENTKCIRFFNENRNGLAQNWKSYGNKFWMNPPYGRQIGKWVKKAYEESTTGSLVVSLLPSRTDTSWFHDYCLTTKAEVRFLRGRLKFGEATNSAPFPSMIVVFYPTLYLTLAKIAVGKGKHLTASFLKTLTASQP